MPNLPPQLDEAQLRAQAIEWAKEDFIEVACRGDAPSIAALATVLFDAAKDTSAQTVFTTKSLSDAVHARLKAVGAAPENGYGTSELNRDLTRLAQRLERAARRFERLGIVRIAGPRAASRGDAHEGCYFLEIETDPLLNPAVAAAVLRSRDDSTPRSFLGALPWIKARYEGASPERRAELDRLAARGRHGLIAALVLIVVGCAAALYYFRSSQIGVEAVSFRTGPNSVETIVRWKTASAVHGPYEVLRDGRLIGTTSVDAFIDRTPASPTSVYRVAGRWKRLARATSRATLAAWYADERIQPCLVVMDADGDSAEALCTPTFAESAFLQESFEAFAEPMDAAAFWGWKIEHSIVVPPEEPEGTRLELSRDVLRIKPGNGNTLTPGTRLARSIQYRQTGRFPLAMTAANGKVLETGRFIHVYDVSDFMKIAITRNFMPPARLLADGKLLTSPRLQTPALSVYAVDRPDQRAIDFAVRLPAGSPYVPIVWEAGRARCVQRDMAPVPGSAPPLYVVRVETDMQGPRTFEILGRRLLFDRTHLGTVAVTLAERAARPPFSSPAIDLSALPKTRKTSPRATQTPH